MFNEPLYELSSGVTTHWASAENKEAQPGAGGKAKFGRKGSPFLTVEAGEEAVLAHALGMGTVRRFWITIEDRSPAFLRGLVLRMYWDGAAKPAVEAPLGDFCCCPLGRMEAFENAWFDTAEGRSFNCRIPMPFKTGFRITVTNEAPKSVAMFYYDVNFTLGDNHSSSTGYFHAHYRRENPTTMQKDFEILPRVSGRGRYLGCSIGVIGDMARYGSAWWGEGEVKMYLDGDNDYPTLCGTGTEDYIGTGWGQGSYTTQWHGCNIADEAQMQYGFYRLHGPDPIYFSREIRVTIQQIGCSSAKGYLEHMEAHKIPYYILPGDGSDKLTQDQFSALPQNEYLIIERDDDWCATAYFYLDESESSLPPIGNYLDRVAKLINR